MSNNPEEIKRDIEATRADLSRDVDALSEKVSPARVLERRVDRTKDAFGGVKDKVMGIASTKTDNGGSGLSTAQDRVSSAASSVAGTATSAPSAVRNQTQGNPLAAGLIAFGTGWLVSSLLPATQREKKIAEAVKETASEHADAIKQPLTQAANEMKDNLQEPAQRAAESLKSTAQDAASNVKDEAKSATQGGDDDAQHAMEGVGNGISEPSTDLRGTPVDSYRTS